MNYNYPQNGARKLGKLETKFALFYVLKTLDIKSAISRTESSWDAYMSYLAELMSRAY
jgi:hypothetical protein